MNRVNYALNRHADQTVVQARMPLTPSVQMETDAEKLQTRNQTMRRVCEPHPGLYAFCNIGKRYKIVCDRQFPFRSEQAYLILNGDLLDDERSGSYAMRRLLVISIAKRHGLHVVTTREGVKMWSDDVRAEP